MQTVKNIGNSVNSSLSGILDKMAEGAAPKPGIFSRIKGALQSASKKHFGAGENTPGSILSIPKAVAAPVVGAAKDAAERVAAPTIHESSGGVATKATAGGLMNKILGAAGGLEPADLTSAHSGSFGEHFMMGHHKVPKPSYGLARQTFSRQMGEAAKGYKPGAAGSEAIKEQMSELGGLRTKAAINAAGYHLGQHWPKYLAGGAAIMLARRALRSKRRRDDD